MKKILWVMGPKEYFLTGIGKYSQLFIKRLRSKYEIDILSINAKPKSIKRYVYQLFVNPIKICQNNSKNVVLYEEGLIYLVPFLKMLKKNIFLIYHHVPEHVDSKKSKVMSAKIYLISKMSQYFLTKINKVIVPSEETKYNLLSKFILSENDVTVIYNPFEPYMKLKKEITKNIFLKKFGIDYKGEFLLLNIGSEEDRKNFTTLLNAMKVSSNQKSTTLIKIGKPFIGENRINNLKIVSENKLNVYFIDFVSEEDLEIFYMLSDLYISPSLHEGFGRTVIEAQFAQLPVIASDIPIYKEILADSAILVKNPSSRESWINVFNNLILDENTKSELIKKSIKNADRFLLDTLEEKWDFFT